jgi:hypothetical protein
MCALQGCRQTTVSVESSGQQQQHYLLQLGWTAAAFPATPAAWFYSELS